MKTAHRRAFLGRLLPLAGAALALLGRFRSADRSPATGRKVQRQPGKKASISVSPPPHSVKRRG